MLVQCLAISVVIIWCHGHAPAFGRTHRKYLSGGCSEWRRKLNSASAGRAATWSLQGPSMACQTLRISLEA